jgi:predicted nuclease of predicted toxin-antitoxin system
VTEPALYIALYFDEDVMEDIAEALRQRGYDALSAAETGMLGRPDDEQLAFAAAQNRAILTYNAPDYSRLGQEWFDVGKEHSGIILSQQFSKREFGELLRQTLRLLNSLTRDEMRNQVFYLQAFR